MEATVLRPKAITAVRTATTERPDNVRIYAVKLLRDVTGLNIPELVPAVDWAIEHIKAVDLERYKVPSEFGWVYEFPNGHRASVVNDHRQAFRFEVLSDDPADAATGRVKAGLTSEQVEAKLHTIAALPTR